MSAPHVETPAEELRRTLAAVVAEAAALRADVLAAKESQEREARLRRRENRTTMVGIGVLSVFMLGVLGVAWQNNQIARDTRSTNAQIVSCTTPAGACFKDGQARTGQAVGDILKASIYMAECSRLRPGQSGPAFDTFLEQCVADKLVRVDNPQPSPTP